MILVWTHGSTNIELGSFDVGVKNRLLNFLFNLLSWGLVLVVKIQNKTHLKFTIFKDRSVRVITDF